MVPRVRSILHAVTPETSRARARVAFLLLVALPLLALPRSLPPVALGAPKLPPADFIVLNAKIYTENPKQPWADALATSGEKIVAVGARSEIEAYRAPKTKIIDAAGRVVLPGFTDCHNHFLEGSLSLDEPDLNGANSVAEMRDRLRDYAASHPGDGWIFGQGWAYDAFGPSGMPTKQPLDEIFPKRPMYLESFDGHTGWVNSRALAEAGISAATPDPPGGKIVRDQGSREPNGVLQEDARHLVKELIPPPSRQQKLAALHKGLALARSYGLVRIHA